jgi:phosphoglycolate phosphatase
MNRAVLFDLDGTLVESAPGILGTFRRTFEKHGITAARPIDTSVIGPPLRETLRTLSGITDPVTIESIAATFRDDYDTNAVAETDAYPGYDATLDAVLAQGFQVHVVTNKRIVPARLIIARLGRGERFSGVYAPDGYTPPLPNKAAVLADVLATHHLNPSHCAFVGDSVEDAAAAAANAVPFIAATYGYGTVTSGHPIVATIGSLAELPARLAALAL